MLVTLSRPRLGDHCEPSPNREYLGKHEVNTSRIPMESTTSFDTGHSNRTTSPGPIIDFRQSNWTRLDHEHRICHPIINPEGTLQRKNVFNNNTFNLQNFNVCMALPAESQKNVILSLCDGMGCLALSLKEALPQYKIQKYMWVRRVECRFSLAITFLRKMQLTFFGHQSSGNGL